MKQRLHYCRHIQVWQERKVLCRLIDCQKLSPEASLHAAQNERLPVRAVNQVMFSEQTKLNRHVDWSGSFSRMRSPNTAEVEPPARCPRTRDQRSTDGDKEAERRGGEGAEPVRGDANANGEING
ncbi:hypothetical protein F3Y22_tig00112611pilonHSYRG00012 [Hibiscus syriacus]|uniref:NPH3 domain-containing protein n=1 Tax=Hibiscus syriacus TaxID=106335 RepID=A0A6A2WV73_HIBSY|nr:hypothetical protein F3Y22_tig00112611pilonHSYRG00012 [Hibiscus syriacus]